MNTKEILAKLIMRALPHPVLTKAHIDVIVDYLVSHGVVFQDIKKVTEILRVLESL